MTSTSQRQSHLTVAWVFLNFDDGGAQRLTLGTWRHLDPGRYRPLLLCVGSEGALVPAARSLGIPVTVLGRMRQPFDIAAVGQIVGHLRGVGADIVHVPLYSRVGPYARLSARLARVPLVVAHEHCRASPPSRRRVLVDRLLQRGTRFVAVSKAQQSELVAAGVAPHSVAVIGNGIDVNRFASGDRTSTRSGLGLTEDQLVVLVPARLVHRKGHVDLIAAVPRMTERLPGLRVLCAGGGPLAKTLPALADSAGVGGVVKFLGHREDMADLLAAADVVCLPSRVEGMPLAALEAMAAGRAVVAAAVDGVPEIIGDGDTGILVDPADPAGLARALVHLLSEEQERRDMGLRGQSFVRSHHTEVGMTRNLESAYEKWWAEVSSTDIPSPAGDGQ